MFLVALVCLSVCLFVDITQNVMNGLGLNFIRGAGGGGVLGSTMKN